MTHTTMLSSSGTPPMVETSNCNCANCYGHYDYHRHTKHDAASCAQACADDANCQASLFDLAWQLPYETKHSGPKCWFYNHTVTTATGGNAKYSCYNKALWHIDIENSKTAVSGTDRKGGWSCDQVCQALSKTCSATFLSALDDDASFLWAYSNAGFNCPSGIKRDCEPNNCQNWGSPYIHNTHIGADGLCWGGRTNNAVASCSQVPADAQHRRLCPCV